MLDVVTVAVPLPDTIALVQGLIPAGYFGSAWLVLADFLAMGLGIVLFRLALRWFESFVR